MSSPNSNLSNSYQRRHRCAAGSQAAVRQSSVAQSHSGKQVAVSPQHADHGNHLSDDSLQHPAGSGQCLPTIGAGINHHRPIRKMPVKHKKPSCLLQLGFSYLHDTAKCRVSKCALASFDKLTIPFLPKHTHWFSSLLQTHI